VYMHALGRTGDVAHRADGICAPNSRAMAQSNGIALSPPGVARLVGRRG
jgi:hypothetical protein